MNNLDQHPEVPTQSAPTATLTPPPSSTEPEPVSVGFVAAYWLAQFCNWVGLLTPLIITIPIKVSQIASDTEKAAQLGIVLTASALVTAFATPLWGALSDRTTLRLGRRKPWMIGGVLAAGLGVIIMAQAHSIMMLGLGWLIAQVAFNANQAVLNAILPDTIPTSQQGKVAGLLGLSAAVAVLTGSFVTQFTTSSSMLMFLVPWGVAIAGLPLLLVALRDTPADKHSLRPYTVRVFLSSFWVNPIKNKDFGWAYGSRFFLVLGQTFLTTYQIYFLTDRLEVSSGEVATFVFFSTTITTVITVVVSATGGFLSDRFGRRKPFVFGAALVTAAGLLFIGTASTFSQFLAGAAIIAIGGGLYYSVDLALLAAIITDKRDAAKEMGVFHTSLVFAQSITPAVGPIFLGLGAVSGGNYPVAFIAAALFAAIGALTILPIRGTR